MKKFEITGMSCAACSSKVQKCVSALDGVTECSVNLLTNSMVVEGDIDDKDIVEAVKRAGYGAIPQNAKQRKENNTSDNDTKKILWRLISSCAILVALMYVSMGHNMWNFPLPRGLSNNYLAQGILQMLLSGIVLVINQKFFINGFMGIIRLSPNMDTLVALGSGAAFSFSVWEIFKMTQYTVDGNVDAAVGCLHTLYFESAAMILALVTVGKMLEGRAKGKTTSAIEGLIKLSPKTAHRVKVDGSIEVIDADSIEVGDIIALYAGESVAADGVITDGSCSLDESMLTGESIPVDKGVGDRIIGGTVSVGGYVKFKAQKVREDTALSEIIKRVSDAAATKAPIAKIADRVAGVFVPTIMVIAAISGIVWGFVSKNAGVAISHAVSVLVISCPCALGLATPVAIMVGSGVGAKNGILYKDATSLEMAGRADIVILDKTGTITNGSPEVTDTVPFDVTENELISYAYAVEDKSEHPLARAIVRYANDKKISLSECRGFETMAGSGVCGYVGEDRIIGGKLELIKSLADVGGIIKEKANSFSKEGKTPVLFAKNNKVIGIVALADAVKPDGINAIEELKGMGIYTVMLTGDNKLTAKAVGDACGVDRIISDVIPSDKQRVVEEYKKHGKVIMVGDGINDAIALTAADVGIAIGAGSDIAIDSADIVLMRQGLGYLPTAIKLSRKTLLNIKENLFWAFFYNMLCIPLAAGVFVSLNGWHISPMIGAFAMGLSSLCVVTNALRLNSFKPHKTTKPKRRATDKFENIEIIPEESKMEITLKIEGMMCPHCEARVKKCLEKNENVISAHVSHTEGRAVVSTNGKIDFSELKAIVEDAGYDVIS